MKFSSSVAVATLQMLVAGSGVSLATRLDSTDKGQFCHCRTFCWTPVQHGQCCVLSVATHKQCTVSVIPLSDAKINQLYR